MHFKRQDIINIIIRAFNDYGYKRAINKRLAFGFNRYSLTCSDCTSLNSIVKQLDNKMLDEVEFYPSMTTNNFDRSISCLLYVSGNWKELCFYELLINNTSDSYYVKICNESETNIIVFFSTNYYNICMEVDDQKFGVTSVKTIYNQKEFFIYDNKTTI